MSRPISDAHAPRQTSYSGCEVTQVGAVTRPPACHVAGETEPRQGVCLLYLLHPRYKLASVFARSDAVERSPACWKA